MDIRQLTTFVAAYEEQSFSRAAERLNATQPGVSTQISLLEQRLESTLFERKPRGVEPTFAGKQLYAKAVKIIHDVRDAELHIQGLAEKITGNINVGLPPTLSNAVVGNVLKAFIETYPDVELRLVEAYSDSLINLLNSNNLDFAIVAKLQDHQGISYTGLFQDRFVAISRAESTASVVSPIDLGQAPYRKIILPSVLKNGLYPLLENGFKSGKIRSERIMEIDSLSATVELVSKSDWVALLPSVSVTSYADRFAIKVDPLSFDINVDYFVAQASREPLSLPAKYLIEQIHTFLKSSSIGSAPDGTHL